MLLSSFVKAARYRTDTFIYFSQGDPFSISRNLPRGRQTRVSFKLINEVGYHKNVNFLHSSNCDSLCLDTYMPLPLLRGRHPHHVNRTQGTRRRRRSVDENFVETLVVADRTMVDAFESKADLQSYIMTLMGVVSRNVADKS